MLDQNEVFAVNIPVGQNPVVIFAIGFMKRQASVHQKAVELFIAPLFFGNAFSFHDCFERVVKVKLFRSFFDGLRTFVHKLEYNKNV